MMEPGMKTIQNDGGAAAAADAAVEVSVMTKIINRLKPPIMLMPRQVGRQATMRMAPLQLAIMMMQSQRKRHVSVVVGSVSLEMMVSKMNAMSPTRQNHQRSALIQHQTRRPIPPSRMVLSR